ncbi:unnamed protein product, partial [Ectocarpus sp. 12 AP-2014]
KPRRRRGTDEIGLLLPNPSSGSSSSEDEEEEEEDFAEDKGRAPRSQLATKRSSLLKEDTGGDSGAG